MRFRQQLVLVFALGSALLVACGSDAPTTGTQAGSSGTTNENAGAFGGDDVSSSGSAGATMSSGGSQAVAGAQALGGSGSGKKTGIVKLSLKVK